MANNLLKTMLIGSVISSLVIPTARYGCSLVDKHWDNTESRGYVVPQRFEVTSVDLNKDGKTETIANYAGKAYLLRVDNNKVPYFQQIEGLESEVSN